MDPFVSTLIKYNPSPETFSRTHVVALVVFFYGNHGIAIHGTLRVAFLHLCTESL